MNGHSGLDNLAAALDHVLDTLGSGPKAFLVDYLEGRYGIRLAGNRSVSRRELEWALTGLIGKDGSKLMMELAEMELQRRRGTV